MNPVAIIDSRAPEDIVKNLRKSGFSTLPVPLTQLVDFPLSGHPDIQMFIHEKNLFVHPDIDISFLRNIEKFINIIQCHTKLGRTYPDDIPYNIACTGTTAIHRKESTDKTIFSHLQKNGIDIIDTKQGYSKCSTLIVDGKSIITSDRSIHTASIDAGIDSLLINPGSIALPGYKYGFIGGAAGRFLDAVYLTGSIDAHPDREMIYSFVESKGLRIEVLSQNRIIDVGSIFFIS